MSLGTVFPGFFANYIISISLSDFRCIIRHPLFIAKCFESTDDTFVVKERALIEARLSQCIQQ